MRPMKMSVSATALACIYEVLLLSIRKLGKNDVVVHSGPQLLETLLQTLLARPSQVFNASASAIHVHNGIQGLVFQSPINLILG